MTTAAPASPTLAHVLPPNHIPPRVGFIVHYWPLQFEKTMDHNQPFRADICYVNDNGTVNLRIHNEIGMPCPRINVALVQGQEPKPGEASFPKR